MFGIHGNEFSPPELGMRFAEFLLEGYMKNADITAILNHTDIHLVIQATLMEETSLRQSKRLHNAKICTQMIKSSAMREK